MKKKECTNIDKDKENIIKIFKECSAFFIAMGDTIRQQLLIDIGASDENGINVNELGKRVHLSRPAVSYHLKILKNSGFISTSKIGTQVYYHLDVKRNCALIKKLTVSLENLMEKEQKC